MSGSMESIRDAAVEGTNKYIRDLQKHKNAKTTRFTFVAFDDLYEVWIDDELVKDAPLIGSQYQPRGMTALNDAIAKTILRLDRSGRKDEKHLVVVLTDGYENHSKEYGGPQGAARLAKLVKSYEKRGNWTFVYLGANDANVKQTAAAIGIQEG